MTRAASPPADTDRELPAGNRRRPDGGASRPESGFAMVWFGLLLTILMAMAGAAVDLWNWWYNGTEQQRAADAAALAGVVFLPGAETQARTMATEIAVANGVDPAALTIETSSDDGSLAANELRVTVDRRVDTQFLHLIGVDFANIRRDATAEYNTRLPMGSPEDTMGRDPEQGLDPGFYVSVSGVSEEKIGGDRFHNIACGTHPPAGTPVVYKCDGSLESEEFSEDGYFFAIEMEAAPTNDIHIEIFDPIHTSHREQDCTHEERLPTAEAPLRIPVIAAQTGDPFAAARYAPGSTPWCTGDVGGGFNFDDARANTTTFIVREPDDTQALETDNAPIAGCSRSFRAMNLRPGGPSFPFYDVYDILDGTDGTDDGQAAYAQETYRRWVDICTISQSTAQGWWDAGTTSIILQVRGNADSANPTSAEPGSNRQGRNHFSIRAHHGKPDAFGILPPTPAAVSVYALGRMPIHNGTDSATSTEFYVTRIPPGAAGRRLLLGFYDVGDARAGGADLPARFTVIPPIGYPGTFTDCSFSRREGPSDASIDMSADASGCTLSNVTFTLYNGRLAEASIGLPSDYTCDLTNQLDCWIKVRVEYPFGGAIGQVYDHTTWTAALDGEPIRLIE